MTDLFPNTEVEKFSVPNASLRLWKNIDLGQPYEEILQTLIDTSIWQQEKISIFGKTHLQPRLSAWYGDSETSYSYSGITMQPNPWTVTLSKIRHRIETLVDQSFNSVLLNLYRDQNDRMGMHSDDEVELGTQPVIASLSLGEERTFLLRHKTRKDLKTQKLPLPSGSLLLMKGNTQRFWKHGIEKEKHVCGPRLNLTFRSIKNALR